MDLQALIALRKYLTIQEHANGKIKLSFSFKILGDNTAMDLIQNMKGKKMPKAILQTKLNVFARQVELEYDSQSIVPNEFDELLTTRNRERFEELVKKYEDILTA